MVLVLENEFHHAYSKHEKFLESDMADSKWQFSVNMMR